MNGAIMKPIFPIIPRTILVVVLLIIGSALQARAQDGRLQLSGLDHLAAKASETANVNVDERMIIVVSKIFDESDPDQREVKKLLLGLKGVYVKSFEFDAAGDYTPADVEIVRSQLRGPSWTRLMDVHSKREGIVEVYVMLNGDQIGGLAVLTAEDKELTVINIVGPVDLSKLAKLEGHLGIPDLDIEIPKPKTKNDQ
jgi:Domain of unknown function (DUF4252)